MVLCSGRLYYDLVKEREAKEAWSTAIVRVEQYYPKPIDEIREQLDRYPGAEVMWAQDEPRNQGAWPFMALNVFTELGVQPTVVSRPASASPAAGRASTHKRQLAELLATLFGED